MTDTTQLLRISLIQSDILWENVDENLSNYSLKIKDLAGNTDIIVLPEMFATGFSMNSEQIAQPQDGLICNWLRDQARTLQCAIVAGAAVREIESGIDAFYNRLIWTHPDGTQQQYSKRHLFRMAGESRHYLPGTEHLIISYKGWNISPFVCYDLRFPVWSRNTVSGESDGFKYDCALYIANWPASRSFHWTSLLHARAIENQAFVIGVNRVGTDEKGYKYSGDSVAISPSGLSISSIKSGREQTETVVLDKLQLDTYRSKFPFILDADVFYLE